MSRRAGVTVTVIELLACCQSLYGVMDAGYMLAAADGQGLVPGWEFSLSGKELSDE